MTASAPAGATTTAAVEAEKRLLGCVLQDPSLLASLTATISVDDLHRGAHRDIYEAMRRVAASGVTSDIMAIQIDLAAQGVIDRVGGLGYLMEVSAAGSPAEMRYYAKAVRDMAVTRRLVDTLTGALQTLVASGDVGQAMSAVQASLDAVADDRDGGRGLLQESTSIVESLARMEERTESGHTGVTGIATGFADIDRITGGLHPGQMVVLAARPGIGKTTLAFDIARHAAYQQKKTVLAFALEMEHEEIDYKILSAQTKVPLDRFKDGSLSDEHWSRVTRFLNEHVDSPLFVDTEPYQTVADIAAKARRHRQRHGHLDLIIIDYLQLLTPADRRAPREQQVAAMSRSIKLLAKQLGIPIIVLSQINRESEQRADKKPMISDLRESGAVEQDSDLIILLYRDDHNNPDSPRVGEADLIIGKHRNGQVGTFTVAAQLHYCRFVDMGTEFRKEPLP